MTAHRATNWLAALAIVVLYGAIQQLDQVDDHRYEQAQAASLVDAQRTEARQLRRDLAAAKLCREEHGEAGFTWTAAGELVCIPRRGKGVVQLAQVQP